MYGTILENTAAEPPAVSPPLQSIECEIWDEDSLEHFLTRSIVPFVNHSLAQAWGYCRKNWSADDFSGPSISMGRGGRAMNPTYDNDNRYRPDWAGICEDIKSKRGTSYRNLCPGDTKLSTKWQSTQERKKDWPFSNQQIQSYCGQHHMIRYGYIITQKELYVVQITYQKIALGITVTRSPRIHAASSASHRREGSSASAESQPSVEKSSAWAEDNSNLEFKHVKAQSIPWSNSGKGKLTIKLALWWLHMLAGAPLTDISVQSEYPPLDSWKVEGIFYRHNSTGQLTKSPAKEWVYQPS